MRKPVKLATVVGQTWNLNSASLFRDAVFFAQIRKDGL